MDQQERNEGVNFNELINEAEEKFRKGMSTINNWGSQAREVIQKQPGAIIAGAAILGFVAGLILRRVASEEERGYYE